MRHLFLLRFHKQSQHLICLIDVFTLVGTTHHHEQPTGLRPSQLGTPSIADATLASVIRLLIHVKGDDHGLDHVLQLDEVAERFILQQQKGTIIR